MTAVPDVLAADLRVVFCGINPGRVSAAAGAHFANPRNDFWRLLHPAGFTSRLYEPREQHAVLAEGLGITNAAYRTTPGAGDLRRADFAESAERLERLARELRPRWIAFVGKEAYRGAFGERAELGVQERRLSDRRESSTSAGGRPTSSRRQGPSSLPGASRSSSVTCSATGRLPSRSTSGSSSPRWIRGRGGPPRPLHYRKRRLSRASGW